MVDFIGIGAQKAGTTWLWGMLRQHPQLRFAPVKEVHYFDVLYLGYDKGRRLRHLDRAVDKRVEQLERADAPAGEIDRVVRLKDRSFAFTDEWYAALFAVAGEGVVSGEITPFYCALPDDGIEHVKRVAPKARFIYLVREPIQRGLSSLRHMTDKQSTIESLLGADRYFARGDYRSNIPRWESHFPAEQFLYIPFGDIKTRPGDVMRAVEEHLGLSPLESYTNMGVPRGSTARREVVLPDGIEQRVAEVFAGQGDYLRQRFGDDFVARIA